MKTTQELRQWLISAGEEFGDPSAALCQLYLRWREGGFAWDDDDLSFCASPHNRDAIALHLSKTSEMPFLVPISPERAGFDKQEHLVVFGLEKIAPTLWQLVPSLNLPGIVHAFVTLYDVPDPAPWERLVVLAGAV